MGDVREPGDPGDQERDDRALHGQDLPGVTAFRRVQRADRVGDGLDPGQRRPAVGEGPRHDVDGAERDQPRVRPDADRARPGVHVVQAAGQFPGHADDDHRDHRDGEQVGRQGEDPARLADAAQVAQAHEQDGQHRDDQQDLGADDRDPGQRRERGHDRGAARGGLHRDRDHVVDQQRDRGDLGHPRPEVLPRHHVRSARPGVHRHHLAVGQHDQQHAEQDQQGHRQHQREGGQAEEREQRVEDLLGAVRGRGEPVAGQHAERQRLGQALAGQLLGDQRRAEQPALGAVPEAVRQLGQLVLWGGHTLRKPSRRRSRPESKVRDLWHLRT